MPQLTINKIAPTQIRFIKLGESGRWEKSCIETDNVIRLGYESPLHQESVEGKWDIVDAFWLNFRSGNRSTATNDIRQVRDFYELDENTLWFTFYKRCLYWCFAQSAVHELPEDSSRVRSVLQPWSCTDINGGTLSVQNLDGRLTQIQGYRGTICELGNSQIREYLVGKINGEKSEAVTLAEQQLANLSQSVQYLINGLWWKDFELLADLIFSQSGWQRISVLGNTEKSIDLDLISPVTGRKAFVQVKSQGNLDTFLRSVEEFEAMGQYQEFYFVVHTATGTLSSYKSTDPRIHLLDLPKLAELVISAGLVRWIINKRS